MPWLLQDRRRKKMIYLILAVLSSTLVSLVIRIGGKYTDRNLAMLSANYLVCIVLACVYTGFGKVLIHTEGTTLSIGLGAINGFLYLAGFALLQINTRKNGVVMSSTFMRLGVLVPTVLSVLIFGEKPELLQVIGFVIALIAIIGISTDGGASDTVIEFKAGLILILLAGGSADAMSKVYDEVGSAELSNQYLVYTFIFALLFCLVLMLAKKQKIGRTEILFGALLSIPNYYSARFLLKAVGQVPAVVAYPTYSVGTIIATSIVGICLFHETINRRQKVALVGILIALVLLNI
jgi:drug/metabolite transporter (DMT)-like permease